MSDQFDDLLQRLAPEKLQETARKVVALAAPQLDRGGRNLIYILPQSNRIGHFGLESQIIRTLYEDTYDRIVIVTGPREESGTNPWITACAGPKIRYVHTGDFNIRLLGLVDGGMQRRPAFDLLLSNPRTTITAFYQHILAGGAVKPLLLPESVEAQARAVFLRNGVDPDEPFVFFHNRTLKYLPGRAYHEHRTADVTTYRDSLAQLIQAGYRIVRLGEAGLDTMGLDPKAYVNVPDWTDNDRAVDLFVCARCAFGLAQNSGPIWVAAAFGNQVLRTNLPFEMLNLPYNDDISLFKHYRPTGSGEAMPYRAILDARLPSFRQVEDIAAAGYELVPNGAEELLAATDELLGRIAGRWHRDTARQQRFQALGAGFAEWARADPDLARLGLTFYGYAYPYGALSQSFLDANPAFLD